MAEPLDRDQRLLMPLAMLGAAILYGLTLMIVIYTGGRAMPVQQFLLVVLLPTALINTIAAIPTFALLRTVDRRGRPAIATEFF